MVLVGKLEPIYMTHFGRCIGVLDFRNKVRPFEISGMVICFRASETLWHMTQISTEYKICMMLMTTNINCVHISRFFLSVHFQVLLTMIWLCRYPSMAYIGAQFRVSVACIHKIIHRMIPIFHSNLVPKYIRWHSMNHWRWLSGTFPEWPRVVAIIDGTPFRISRPKGCYQRLYWRGDRHCFFLNWNVIIDVAGFVVLSRPGFQGHLHDSTCLS